MLVIQDGSARLDTNYLLQTDDTPPAFIAVKMNGWRTGDAETSAKLSDPKLEPIVRPMEYCLRLYIHLETGEPHYRFLNTGMRIASGARTGNEGKINNQEQI